MELGSRCRVYTGEDSQTPGNPVKGGHEVSVETVLCSFFSDTYIEYHRIYEFRSA